MNEERTHFIGGTFLSFMYSLLQPELIKNIVLAIAGTLTSYACSRLLAAIKRMFNSKKEKK